MLVVTQKSSSTVESDMMETDNDGGAAVAAAGAEPKEDQVSQLIVVTPQYVTIYCKLFMAQKIHSYRTN